MATCAAGAINTAGSCPSTHYTATFNTSPCTNLRFSVATTLVEPRQTLVGTTALVTIEGTNFGLAANESNIFCDWGAYGQIPALYNTPTAVYCESPMINTTALINVTVIRDNKHFSTGFEFDVYSS